MEKVLIVVQGGVAHVADCPPHVEVEIIDYDDLEASCVPDLISCQECEATGRILDEKCSHCWGTGLVSEDPTIESIDE